ncbi:MAG: glycosyl transferase family 90 [Rikenellaceae bacterium]
MSIKYLVNNGKNSKLKFYVTSYLRYFAPKFLYQNALPRILREYENLSSEERNYIDERVNYHCKLPAGVVTPLPVNALTLGSHTLQNHKESSCYFFDSYEYTRYFNDDLRWIHLFGDVIDLFSSPTIVKSRPLLKGDNANSVVLNLNKIRHFITLNDRIKFGDKSDKAIFRGDVEGKMNRYNFVSQYINHPMCDVGDVRPDAKTPVEWRREPMSLYEHLKHKFIFALEGNDVASNLKWIMSSNSVAVMPTPTCETWFMEGRLKSGEHYIEIAQDFSDVEKQLQYYLDHPKESIEIAQNANRFVAQFQNPRRERLISILVLLHYFERTGQL